MHWLICKGLKDSTMQEIILKPSSYLANYLSISFMFSESSIRYIWRNFPWSVDTIGHCVSKETLKISHVSSVFGESG